MPKLSENARRNKAAYDMKYAKEHIVRKQIPFNEENPDDAEMLEFLNEKGKGQITGYIKGLIREDMLKAGK